MAGIDVNVNQPQHNSVLKSGIKTGIWGGILGGAATAATNGIRIKAMKTALTNDKAVLDSVEKEALENALKQAKTNFKKITAAEAGKCALMTAGLSMILTALINRSQAKKATKQEKINAII